MIFRMLIAIMLAAGLAGCHTGQHVTPDGWQLVPDDGKLAERSAAGRLQVFICYGPMLSTHAALRVELTDGGVFWDPAGGFAVDSMEGNAAKHARWDRRNDVMWADTPSVLEYWHFREVGCNEPFMEMYEWDLDDAEAQQLHDAIRKGGSRITGEKNEFRTGTAGMFCCIAVCKYLQRFASHRMTVPEQWLMPHKLGAHLFSQKPSRVWLFVHGEPLQQCVQLNTHNVAE